MTGLTLPQGYDLARRMTEQELAPLLSLIESLSFFRRVLDSMPELVGVITPTRQIVLANRMLLGFLGLEEDGFTPGLRPGEALNCIHSHRNPAGCGNSRFCVECGALQTIMRAISEKRRASGECRITCERGGLRESLDLMICCAPFDMGGHDFNLLMAQDISDAKRRNALERIFFHDILNVAGHVKGFAALLRDAGPEETPELTENLMDAVNALVEDVLTQSDLGKAEDGVLTARREWVDAAAVLEDVARSFGRRHPGRACDLTVDAVSVQVRVDPVLLRRVLRNMVKNALEATAKGDPVVLSCRREGEEAVLAVRNPGVMDESVQLQVFQRYFSTKGSGRGLGTYSMRLLAERYLRGSVGFSSTQEGGTVFFLRLPIS